MAALDSEEARGLVAASDARAADADAPRTQVLRVLHALDGSIAQLQKKVAAAPASCSDAGQHREGLKPSPWVQVRRSVLPGLEFSAMSRLIDQVRPEAEGSDALLFSSVPTWIRHKNVPGCRYRMVTGILDGGDETKTLAVSPCSIQV